MCGRVQLWMFGRQYIQLLVGLRVWYVKTVAAYCWISRTINYQSRLNTSITLKLIAERFKGQQLMNLVINPFLLWVVEEFSLVTQSQAFSVLTLFVQHCFGFSQIWRWIAFDLFFYISFFPQRGHSFSAATPSSCSTTSLLSFSSFCLFLSSYVNKSWNHRSTYLSMLFFSIEVPH